MKTILVPTDFSKNAENALQYALEFALKLNANIILLNACPLPYDFASPMQEAITSMQEFSEENLQKLIENAKKEEKYKFVTVKGHAASGSTVYSILDAIQQFHVDMIIMGTKGASGLGKVFFGSNTAEILRRAKVPVLVIPKDAVYKKMSKLVCAIDYREDDLNVLQELGKLADLFNFRIETIHVAPEDSLHEQIMHRGLIQLIEDKIPNLITDNLLIINKSFSQGIEEYLNNNLDSVLAMAHYKKPFLQELFSKSDTEEMAYHIKTPLLVFNQQ